MSTVTFPVSETYEARKRVEDSNIKLERDSITINLPDPDFSAPRSTKNSFERFYSEADTPLPEPVKKENPPLSSLDSFLEMTGDKLSAFFKVTSIYIAKQRPFKVDKYNPLFGSAPEGEEVPKNMSLISLLYLIGLPESWCLFSPDPVTVPPVIRKNSPFAGGPANDLLIARLRTYAPDNPFQIPCSVKVRPPLAIILGNRYVLPENSSERDLVFFETDEQTDSLLYNPWHSALLSPAIRAYQAGQNLLEAGLPASDYKRILSYKDAFFCK